MVILNISRSFFWTMGKRAGVPSVYLPMKGLADAGHQVHYLYPDYGADNNHEIIDGICVHRFRLPFGLTREEGVSKESARTGIGKIYRSVLGNLRWFFFNLCGTIEGFKIARRVQADLIYAHTEQTALIAYVLSRLLSLPFVVRIYGLGGLYWQMDKLSAKIKHFRTLLAFKVPADRFIIIEDGNNSHLVAERMGVSRDKIANWRNGVDFNIYNPDPNLKLSVRREFGIEVDKQIILCVSRLDRLKRVDRLISSLPALFKKRPDCVCVIVGDGNEKGNLEKICRDSGIGGRVIFTGSLPRDRVVDLHNAADIFVALSDYSNCGNALWEAMVCAKCIVTLDNNEGTKEIIRSGYNGILISIEELNRLPEIIDSLLNNEQQRKTLGANARKVIQDLLESWDTRIKKEIKLIEEVAGNSRGLKKGTQVC